MLIDVFIFRLSSFLVTIFSDPRDCDRSLLRALSQTIMRPLADIKRLQHHQHLETTWGLVMQLKRNVSQCWTCQCVVLWSRDDEAPLSYSARCCGFLTVLNQRQLSRDKAGSPGNADIYLRSFVKVLAPNTSSVSVMLG